MNLTDDFSYLIGTIRTDHRGWRYVVDSVKFKRGGRFSSDSLAFDGRCIEDKPSGVTTNSTTFDAYCYEMFYDVNALAEALRTEEEEATVTDNQPETPKHFVTLTKGQYQALAKFTSGDPKYQTDKLKSLRVELDRAQYNGRKARYEVRFSSRDLESAAYVLRVHALRNGVRHINRLMREYGHLMDSASV